MWLIKDHFNSLETVFLVSELPSQVVIKMLAVLSGLIAQVVEHLLGPKVLTSNFLCVHQSLTHREELMLAHFDHLGQFTLFLVQARILLLLLSQFRCGIEQKLEV